MRVEIDTRPSADINSQPPFFAIRLFPETNEEMARLAWGHRFFAPRSVTSSYSPGGELSYVVQFKAKGRDEG